MTDQPKAFTELERQIIGFCESEWFLKGSKPTPETLCSKFGMTPKAINTFLERPEVRQSFNSRGIPHIEGRDLTAEQITVINLILNLHDARSEKKKLADSGVSARTWEGWKRDPKVREYMRSRSEDILNGAIPDAHLALVDRVRAGDMGALKFYYEMTGRYTGQNAQLDPRILLTKVFDIIAKHIQNPIILQAIATDFQLLAGLDQTANLNTRAPVAGEVVGVENTSNPVARF
jgi:hypothetical protein